MPNTSIPAQIQKQEVRGYSWFSWRRRGGQTPQIQPNQETSTDVKSQSIEEQIVKEVSKTENLSVENSPKTEKGNKKNSERFAIVK